jgi:hypothetical protein
MVKHKFQDFNSEGYYAQFGRSCHLKCDFYVKHKIWKYAGPHAREQWENLLTDAKPLPKHLSTFRTRSPSASRRRRSASRGKSSWAKVESNGNIESTDDDVGKVRFADDHDTPKPVPKPILKSQRPIVEVRDSTGKIVVWYYGQAWNTDDVEEARKRCAVCVPCAIARDS